MRVDEDPRHYPHIEHTDERPTDDEAALADVDAGEFPPDGHDRDRAPTDEVSADEPAVGVAEAPTEEPPDEPVPEQLEPTSTVYRDEHAAQEAHDEEAHDEEAQDEEAHDEADRPHDTDVMTAAAAGPDHAGETERAEEDRVEEERAETEAAPEAETTPEAGTTPEAEAAAEPEELAPGEAPAAAGFVLWEAEVVDGYRDRWQQIQLRFIDHPRNAAQQAQALTVDVCEGLSDALTRHRAELDRWQGAQLEDTEELRMTVRRYRDLLDRLLGL